MTHAPELDRMEASDPAAESSGDSGSLPDPESGSDEHHHRVYPRLTNEQLEGMSMWDRDVMLADQHRAAGSYLVKMAIAEIRARRALDLTAEDISRIRATRAEMARFDFLDQIPELIQTLDRILAAYMSPEQKAP